MLFDKFWEGIITIATLIVGVAMLALILSPKAQTTGVIQASASGFGNDLAVAEAPVTGAQTNINLSYPNSGAFGTQGFGMPQFGAGMPSMY
jgi:hypothetical protein